MTNCTICNSTNISSLKNKIFSVYTKNPYKLTKCNDCTHIFTDPLPTNNELNDIYTNKYSYDLHLLIKKEKIYIAKNVAKYISTIPDIKSIFEIGCMYGYLLNECKKLDFECSGIEIDKKASKACIEKHLNVNNISLEKFTNDNTKKFDLIIMSHSLEHIINPYNNMQKLHKMLNKNGKLLLIVPNISSWTFKMFGKYWGYLQVPVHINHFNKKSLNLLLKKSGFKSIDYKYTGGDSLMFLSTLANFLKIKSDKINLSSLKKNIIKTYSAVVKYWYKIGDENLIILAEKI